MPELPEVERVRLVLAGSLRGLVVSGVRVHRRDVIATPSDPAGGFARSGVGGGSGSGGGGGPRRVASSELLGGDVVAGVERLGKQLALFGGSGRVVNVHLGMTGSLRLIGAGRRLGEVGHVHVVWRLRTPVGEPAGRLVFRDPRRFGGLWTARDAAELRARRWGALGPDALTVTSAELMAAGSGSRRAIKALLLDQRAVAGVGNIYADEALHAAGIDPSARACDLAGGAWSDLAECLRGVLGRAIEAGGSTLRDFVDANGVAGGYRSAHRVYGRGGLACLTCGRALSSGLVAQRTTVWCSACQRQR